jgi:hypothetical protein
MLSWMFGYPWGTSVWLCVGFVLALCWLCVGFVFPWDDNQRFRNKDAESCTSRKACARVSSYREAVFTSSCSCQKILRPVIGVPMGVRKHEPIITFATDWTLGITVKYFSIPRKCTVSSDSLVVFAGCALLRNPSERYLGDTPMRSGISVVKMYPLELISSITSLMQSIVPCIIWLTPISCMLCPDTWSEGNWAPYLLIWRPQWYSTGYFPFTRDMIGLSRQPINNQWYMTVRIFPGHVYISIERFQRWMHLYGCVTRSLTTFRPEYYKPSKFM